MLEDNDVRNGSIAIILGKEAECPLVAHLLPSGGLIRASGSGGTATVHPLGNAER